MNNTLRKALYIILTSLGLALVFNYLFFSKMIGISVLIFALILLGTVFLFARYQQLPVKKTWWLMSLIAFFSLMPSIRANEFLSFLNIVTVLGLLILLAHELLGMPVFLMRLIDYSKIIVFAPFRMIARALATLHLISQIHSTVKNRDVWVRVIKGVLMALPILIIFGLLFSQADLAFSQFLKNFINIQITERTAQYIALLIVVFVAALCFLAYIFNPKQTQPTSQQEPSNALLAQPGKNIEVLVFLGLIAALFLIFIIFQITYLFGGETNIIHAGFTYAEYARRGFWELLVVAILSLLILIASEKYAGAESAKDKKFLTPSLILIAEVLVVIISAFKRLSIYIDAYSLTLLRFYVAAFIILLLVLFILLAIKFIKSKPERFFTFGTLLLAITFLIVINIVNPDAFIAKSNLERYNRTGKIDVSYVGRLSADAETWKVDLYKKSEGENKVLLELLLQSQKDKLKQYNANWQSANFSRVRALDLLETF